MASNRHCMGKTWHDERRSRHQVGKEIAKGISEGRIKFFDKHLSMVPDDLV